MAFVKFEDSAMFGLQDECLEVAIWFVCFPYDKIIKNATTNDLRRAAYQCFLWEHVSDKGLDLPSPMKNGKVISEGRLEPIYIILEENYFAVHVLLMSKRMQNQHCTCQKVNLMYTNACRCDQTDFNCKNIEHFDINEYRGNEQSPVFALYYQKESYQGKTICSGCEEIIISCKFPLTKLWLKYHNFKKNGFQHASSILDVINSLFHLKSTLEESLSIPPPIFLSKFSLKLSLKVILNECFLILECTAALIITNLENSQIHIPKNLGFLTVYS